MRTSTTGSATRARYTRADPRAALVIRGSPEILLEEVRREADVSAEQSEEEEDSRIPDPHADPGWPTHPGSSQDQAPGHPVGLNVSVPPRRRRVAGTLR
jgi:hypothetical protein